MALPEGRSNAPRFGARRCLTPIALATASGRSLPAPRAGLPGFSEKFPDVASAKKGSSAVPLTMMLLWSLDVAA